METGALGLGEAVKLPECAKFPYIFPDDQGI